jgi:putative protease
MGTEMTAPRHTRPELLAPAGNMECARAAVANGADAIYFGLPRFNARLRADNFTEEELPTLMEFLHSHGVRGFVTMNTLIFTGELPDAEKQLRLLEEAGVDAIIVQDVGLAVLARRVAPRLEIHASTQMTITSPESLAMMNKLGLDRAVLARECSLRELERFKEVPVPLEVFVHGALCVAYSGQCLTSESLGQRSANRGECAQACRMPYQLVVDGELRELGDRRYLLSPQDLAAVEEVPRLIELGVASFKIEGRLKSPEYVAAVTKVYRKAIDAALARSKAVPALSDDSPARDGSAAVPLRDQGRDGLATVSEQDRYELEMTFSRGLFTGWMHGVDHQRLVGARFGKKRGALVGRVRSVGHEFVELDRAGAWLKPGDGVVFDSGGDTDHEQGGRVYEMSGTRLAFQRGKLDFAQIKPGDRVWKTSDQALDSRLRATFAGDIAPRQTLPLRLEVSGRAGEVMKLRDAVSGVEVVSEIPLQVAQKRPLTEQSLREQLSRLGGSRFFLESLTTALEGEVILPVSELNRMRRALVEEVNSGSAFQAEVKSRAKGVTGLDIRAALDCGLEGRATAQESQLIVLCRSLTQLKVCAAAGVTQAYLDLEDIRGYADAMAWVRAESEMEVYLATPRIQKAGEQGFFKLIERSNPHGVLVRNAGAIAHFTELGIPCAGDFSLNVANPITAEWFLQQGLERLTISYDLNIGQVLDLLRATPPEWFELTIHQHMPMFHMEHCVFAAFMSNGSSFLDCGRPCERHQVKLRDRVGMDHPLKADVGCRNTLFNAVAQTGARYYHDLHAAGLRRWRVELLEESEGEVRRILDAYRALLSGATSGEELWRELKAQSQLGVTGGTLQSI